MAVTIAVPATDILELNYNTTYRGTGEQMHFAWCPYQEWGKKCILLGVLTRNGGTNEFCLVSSPGTVEQMHFAWCPY